MRKFSYEQNLNTQKTKIIETKKNTNSMSLTKDKSSYKGRERWKINRGKNYIMIINRRSYSNVKVDFKAKSTTGDEAG